MGETANAYIKGIGSYLPKKTLESGELEKRLELENGWIAKKTGIEQRQIAADGECVSDLATGAARSALENAGLGARDLDLIILSTSMGDMFFPSTACVVQDKLGASAPAFDLCNACAGFIYGLSAASAFIKTGQYRNILVVAAETLSRMVNWDDYRTCILFGDGAGACVVSDEGSHRLVDFHLGADGSGAEVLKLPGGGSRNPVSEKVLKESLNTIYMEGGEVFRFAMKIIGQCINEVCEKTGFDPAELDKIIPHQSNSAIIKEAANRLGVAVDKFHMNLNEVGNTASASVPIALTDAVSKGKVKSGDTIALVSYGAGLAYAATTIKW